MNHAILFSGICLILAGMVSGGCGGRGGSADHAKADSTTMVDQADSMLLVPGQSAGLLKLGDADSVLLRAFGPPHFSDAAMGKAVLVWYADTSGNQVYPLSVFTARDMGNDETARIRQIRVTSPLYGTQKSIRIGCSLGEIMAAYPATLVETYEADGAQYTIHGTQDGIAFELDTAERCVSIIIHEADATIASYLPLRGIH